MRKITLILAAINLLLCTGCAAASSPEPNVAAPGDPSAAETSAQEFDLDTPEGLYAHTIQKMMNIEFMQYTMDQTTIMETSGTKGTIEDSLRFSARLEDGKFVEFSDIGTVTTNGAATSVMHYCSDGVLYVSTSNGSFQTAYPPEMLNPDITISAGEGSVPISEMLGEASIEGNKITASSFSISAYGMTFNIKSLEINLRDDGLFDTVHVQYSYGDGYSADVDKLVNYTSYTEAQMEKPEGYESFPEQEVMISDTAKSIAAIGVANDLTEQGEYGFLSGHFILSGAMISGLPISTELIVPTPSALLMLDMNNDNTFANPVTLSPQLNSSYFLNTDAKPIDSIDVAAGTFCTGGETVSISSEALFLVWNTNQWESVSAQDIVGASNFYYVYADPGEKTICIIIQQHDTYMP